MKEKMNIFLGVWRTVSLEWESREKIPRRVANRVLELKLINDFASRW